MDNRSRYQRFFLIFDPEDAGFGVGQEPSGYVKIEVNEGKGKLLASVQNLSENRGLQYKLYMFRCGEGNFAAVCAGKITLSRSKGELKWDFDPDNVGGSKVRIQELNIAAVIGEDEKSEGMLVLCPLAAYKNGKVSWRESFRNVDRIYKHEKPQPKGEAVKPVSPPEKPKSEAVKPVSPPEKPKGEVVKPVSPPEKPKGEAVKPESPPEKPKGEAVKPVSPPEKPKSEAAKPENVAEKPKSEAVKQENVTSKYEYDLESKHSGPNITSTVENVQKEIGIENNQKTEMPAENEKSGNLLENQITEGTVEEVEIVPEENLQENPVKGSKGPISTLPSNDFDEYQKMLKDLEMKEKGAVDNKKPAGCSAGNQGFCMPLPNYDNNSPCSNCQANIANQRQSPPSPSSQTSSPAAKQVGNIERLRINLDKYFEAYDPFRSRRRDYRWWKVGSPVQLNNILYQCDIKTPLLFNPALMMAHFKYRHLIVGIYADRIRRREYIVCGVPGVYNVDEKPFGNMCRWAQVEGSRPRHGAFGYWLVYIDGKSGKFLSVN